MATLAASPEDNAAIAGGLLNTLVYSCFKPGVVHSRNGTGRCFRKVDPDRENTPSPSPTVNKSAELRDAAV
jgi:hypothetical protein